MARHVFDDTAIKKFLRLAKKMFTSKQDEPVAATPDDDEHSSSFDVEELEFDDEELSSLPPVPTTSTNKPAVTPAPATVKKSSSLDLFSKIFKPTAQQGQRKVMTEEEINKTLQQKCTHFILLVI